MLLQRFMCQGSYVATLFVVVFIFSKIHRSCIPVISFDLPTESDTSDSYKLTQILMCMCYIAT